MPSGDIPRDLDGGAPANPGTGTLTELEPASTDLDIPTTISLNATILGSKIALIDDDGALTFEELWRHARAAAEDLDLDLAAGSRVAVAWEPSAAQTVLFVALLLRGWTVIPLNIRLSPAELAEFVARVDPQVLVADRTHQAQVSTLGRPVVIGRAGAGGLHFDRPSITPVPASLPLMPWGAFVIGTGGTTGIPKGAITSRRAAGLWTMSAVYSQQLRRTDVELYGSPFFHATILTNLLAPLAIGATVRILPRFTLEAACAAVLEDGVTRIGGAPTMIIRLLDEAKRAPADWARVRMITFGGAKPPPNFIAKVREALPSAELLSGYGSTEFGPVARRFDAEFVPGLDTSVGRPAPHVELRVVGPDGELTSEPGVVGEIAVRSPWQTSGYVGSPAETAATYRSSGEILLGDIGEFDNAGHLHLRGRSKEMIITGGENVFPLEVEAVLAEAPGVAEVAVYGVPDEYWGERVEAAVVADGSVPVTLIGLRTFARARLANYKLPRALLAVEALPLTSNHKVDRRGLSLAQQQRPSPEKEVLDDPRPAN